MKAVEHRFVTELYTGKIPDRVMATYLIQDHRFLDSFLTLIGAAMATADNFAAGFVSAALPAWSRARKTPISCARLTRSA